MANHTKGRPPPNKTLGANNSKTVTDKIRMAKGKPRRGAPTSIDKYDRMWEAYQVEQTAHYVSKMTGVSRATARKYIEQGDPKRAMRPLRERWIQVQTTAQQRNDYDLAKARQETMAVARAGLAKVAAAIKAIEIPESGYKACPHCGGQVPMPKGQANMIKMLGKLRDVQSVLWRALGEPDIKADVTARRNPMEDWTEAQLREYLTSGRRPDDPRPLK